MFKNVLPILAAFWGVTLSATPLSYPTFLRAASGDVKTLISEITPAPALNVTLSVSNEVAAKTGDTVCVKVKAKNFQNIGSIELNFTFDSTVIRVVNVKSAGLNITPGDYNLSKANTLKIIWFDIAGKTLPDDSTLFEICYRAIGPAGSISTVAIKDLPELEGGPSMIEDVSGNFLTITSRIDGSVKIGTLAFEVITTIDSANCNGSSDGRINITPRTTSGPFRYTWQNTAVPAQNGTGTIAALNTTGTISGLAAGTYSVKIFNAANDSVVLTLNVRQPDRIFILLPTIVNPCPGQSNGKITFGTNQIGGGKAPYTYVWSTGARTLEITNLAAGAYEFTVTDSKGCRESNRYTLGAVSIAVTNSRVFPALCREARNGAIEISGVSGGTATGGNYTFRWSNNPVNVGSSSINPNLGAGIYTVTITDDNRCELIQSYSVPASRVLSSTKTVTNVTCAGSSNGSIVVSVRATGSENIPYTFQWDARILNPINTAGRNSLVQNLAGGTYTLRVTDGDGCILNDTFNLTEPPAIITNALVNKPGCTGQTNGRIVLRPSGGLAPYTYRWSPITNTTDTARNLSAGTYSVTITDGRNCNKDTAFVLTSVQGPVIDRIDIKNASCFDRNDGEAEAFYTPAPSTTITNVAWSNGGSIKKIIGLARGDYSITVVASDGCSISDTITIGSPPQLMFDTANISFQNPRCPSDSNGNIVLSVRGGTAPYRYFWSGGQPTSSPVFLGLKSGSYIFTVTDFNLCPNIIDTLTLTTPPEIILSFIDKEKTSCQGRCINGRSDGKVTGVASGGNGLGIFSYQWSSGETSARAVELCGGWQKVSVTDNECIKLDSVFIEEPEPFNVQARTLAEPTCHGDRDGSIEITVSGGTRPYNFNWSTGVNNTTGLLTNLAAGNYSAVITDGNNCRYIVSDYALLQPAPLRVDTIADKTSDVRCFGQSNGQIFLRVTGGNGGLKTFQWRNYTAARGDSLINIPAGSYVVTVTDSKGCDTVFSYNVNQPEPIFFSGVAITPPVCHGGDAFVTVGRAFGGTKLHPFFFSVDEGPLTQLGTDFLVLAGTHKIRVTEQFTECSVDTTITVSQPPPIKIAFVGDSIKQTFDGYRLVVGLGKTVRLNPDLTSSLPIDTAKTFWTPKTYMTPTGDLLRPIIRPLDDIGYKLIVTDLNGCKDSANIDIELERDRNLFIPNVFTPDDDGDERNNKFTVYSGLGVKKINFLQVFNRWGEMMYAQKDIPVSNEPTIGWDGTFNNRPVQSGVYVYIVEVEFEDGAKLTYRGDVTLVR